MNRGVLTVGHSNGTLDHLISLVRRHPVDTVVDIRTQPYSSRHPQFNRSLLEIRCKREGLRYIFAGDAIGGHPNDARFYLADGRVDFDLVEAGASFKRALDSLVDGSLATAPILLCSEADPLNCPRFFSIGRLVAAAGVAVGHVQYRDGDVLTHRSGELQMLRLAGLDSPSLLSTEAEQLADGYAHLKRAYKFRRSSPAG